LPGDRKRAAQILEIREAVPAAVNELVGSAKRTIGPAIEKVAGDMVVPFDQLGAMVRAARAGFDRRGLDHAIWGHVSDGNLHPNVIPHSVNDVRAGKEAILELGREVATLGGCPLAEHGVGRSAVKQELLRQLYGTAGIQAMREVKRALDPEWKLSPGVLFPK
jgi:D-lactate dehydrogenase (cytochrome)